MIESLNHTQLTVEAWKGGVPSIQGSERGPPPPRPTTPFLPPGSQSS